MFKNVSGQKLSVFVFDSTTNLPKTGDAANLTAYVSKDDGTVTVLGDTSATEQDSTNAKGYYIFDLTQGETNADKLMFSCKSATASMVAICVPAVVYTTPPNFSSQSIDSNGRLDIIKVNGTSQTAGDIIGDTNDIQARLPAALVGGRIDASVGAMAADVLTSSALAASAVNEIADQVWDEAISGHLGAGSTGAALNAAGSAGDPWSTALPGAYSAGEAGYIVGTYLDEAITVAAAAILSAIGGLPTAAENATELLDQADGCEANKTVRDCLRLMLAALVGILSGAAGTHIDIRDTNNTKNRISMDVDSNGNRTNPVLDAS